MTMPRVARIGVAFAAGPAAVSVLLLLSGLVVPGAVAGVVALAVLLFFRDPERIATVADGDLLSPADGRIVAVDTGEENRFLGAPALRISVFMSVFNVHVNRIPADGTVLSVRHVPGGFAMAHLDDVGVINERTEIHMEDEKGRQSLMVQVAGLVARRIICRLRAGDEVRRGERFGLICFGSRVDLYIPTEAIPNVKLGDRVTAGRTVLARLV
ncbi:MAG: phosphatidylserine decarboxylase family protein [bacterium]|nr:phosphatidylserine decarboxylase family protein [bacterium]MDT8396093.1 phosphatidylserine decarboxylase family protein [bacterium]